jgi:hypothetical protein
MQQVARAAYYTSVKITAVKGFVTLASGSQMKCLKEKKFLSIFFVEKIRFLMPRYNILMKMDKGKCYKTFYSGNLFLSSVS